MSLKAEFQKEVLEKLAPLSEQLTSVLEKLIAYDYPKEVKTIHFEVFSDGFTTEFPMMTFFLDADNTEFFVYDDNGNAHYPCNIDPELIQLEAGVYDEALEAKYQNKDAYFDSDTYASEVLLAWFSDIWQKLSGQQFKLNAFISVHDDTPINLTK